MRISSLLACAAAIAGSCLATPVLANVHAVSDAGFVVRLSMDVPAKVEATWQELGTPANWWNPEHSYSGDAGNFTLEQRPGGCFCETLPGEGGRLAAPRGGVEHMRVVYVDRGKTLRMTGGLGPLQSEAAVGTLTMALKPVDAGTRIMWEYVVGGYLRTKPQELAPLVDAVLAEQLGRLAIRLGARRAAPDGEPARPVGPPAPTDPNSGR